MKKKITKTVLYAILYVVIMSFVGFTAFAVNLTNHTFYNKLIVNGDIPVTELSNYVGKSVSMTLKNVNDILYIGEEIVKENGSYEFVVDIGDYNAEDLDFKVRIGNDDIQDTLLSAISKSSECVPVQVNVKVEGTSARITADLDEIDALCDKYTVIAAVYKNGVLKNVKTYDENLAEIDTVSNKLFLDAKLDGVDNEDTVKIFVWQDFVKNLPLSKANKQIAGDPVFQDGDVVAVVGDSITDDYGYPTQLEAFYMTRYPEREITFYNKGINGEGAEKIYKRLNWDILKENPNKVMLMYGVNDVWWHNYDTEAGHNKKLEASCTNTGKLIDSLLKKNIKPILVTPTVYDEREIVTGATAQNDGTDAWITKLCAKLKTMAAEKDVELLDVNTITKDITYREENAEIKYVITGSDRIHPNPTHGSLLIAYSILKEQGVDPYVASVDIASDGTVNAYNCEVSNLVTDGNKISYTYSPKSEPMAQNGGYNAALAVLPELTEALNNEIIKIGGFDTDGKYNLTLNGVDAGSYAGAEFEKGINIATLVQNPNLERANSVYTELSKKRTAENKLRDIAITVSYNDGQYAIYSELGYDRFLKAFASNMFINSYKKFWEYAQIVEEIENTMDIAWEAAREYAQPVSYTVEITAQ